MNLPSSFYVIITAGCVAIFPIALIFKHCTICSNIEILHFFKERMIKVPG